ncbi:MAG: DeoR/GlpR transcriptional regulator [Rhodobacteraceae bacterium]|nr:DeoR/GlpR transcriptional regulator [Paracoccaceae bacterium]
MDPKARRDEIVAFVSLKKEVSVEELASRLDVSRETVRRDLALLDDAGRLRKYHGSARALSPEADPDATESPYAQRLGHNRDAKKAIALAAARCFQPGDTLFIDTGSTTVAVAEALAAVPHLTVITNSPRIAALVAANRTSKVFMVGGAFNVEVGENLGPLAVEQIRNFRAQHAILTVGALDGASIMDFDLQEAEIARAMIERSERVTIVADHSKLGRKAVFDVATLGRIARLITDAPPPPALSGVLAQAGVEVIVASA